MSQKGRRRFLGAAAALPLAPLAQVPTPAPVPAPSPSPPPSPAASTLADLVEQRWGKVIDPAWKADIRDAIEGNLKAGDRLRAVKLTNADEPVTVFEARPPRRRA